MTTRSEDSSPLHRCQGWGNELLLLGGGVAKIWETMWEPGCWLWPFLENTTCHSSWGVSHSLGSGSHTNRLRNPSLFTSRYRWVSLECPFIVYIEKKHHCKRTVQILYAFYVPGEYELRAKGRETSRVFLNASVCYSSV